MARISKPPEVRRQEMIEKARVLFREKGYDGTSVRDIVRGLGVAQGLFYYYFSNKEEVLFAVLEREGEQLIGRIAQSIAAPDVPPVERMRDALFVIADFLMHGYDAIWFSTASTHLRILFERQTHSLLMPYLVDLLTDGNRCGDFDVVYPEFTAQFILAGFIGVCVDAARPTGEEIVILLQNFVERILALPKHALSPEEKE